MVEAVKQLASTILHKHYCENDIEYIIGIFAPDITWIGAGDGQHLDSYDEIVEFFRQCKGAIPSCRIWGEEYHATKLSSELYLCDGEAWIATDAKDGLLVKVHQRFSFVFRKTDTKLECVHIHCSNPYQEMTAEELFPDRVGKATYDYVQETIQDIKNAEIVLNAISGGLKISRDDDNFSYVYVSDELCAMFGYSKEEFMEVTGGSAVGAVYPPDLSRALDECNEAFKKGPDYATKYRIRCKDGTLKWIIDSGKKQTNIDGAVIINSIYLDVTSFENANLKIAEQRDFLDSIYSSIMCGILRYRVEGNSFAFITLNNEALNMLGYTSQEECYYQGVEEFYQRIHPDDRRIFMEKIASLQHPGEYFSHEFRIQSAKGKVIWVYGVTELVRDTDGKNIIQRTMIDITDRKELEMELEEERKRFRIAIESSPAIIFEYDIQKDSCTTYGSLEKVKDGVSHEGTIPNFLNGNMQKQIEKPYWEQVTALLRGRAGTELVCRMASYFGGNHILWAKITLAVLYSGNHKPIKTIGKVRNIQSEKEKEFALVESRSRDGLTGLYTSEAGIQMVREYMDQKDPSESCSILLLDLDNFSEINEAEGSVFADVVLQEVADIIKTEAGKEAIRIRLGGDEFMIFLKRTNKEDTTTLGSRIAQLISNLFVKEVISVKISASIGMCNTTAAGAHGYDGLYRCAESALKFVKTHKKGQAACYLDASKEMGVELTKVYQQQHLINEIDTHGGRKEKDLIYALDLLGKAKNLDDAITLLLSRIGRSYQLDRISIIEVSRDYFSYHYNYQWAKNPAEQQLGTNFYLGKEEFEKIKDMYDEDGLCEVGYGEGADHTSNLHAAIWNRGVYAGALNFRKNELDYQWTEEQKNFLKELVKIVSSYIMKARADAVSQAKTDFLSKMSHEIRTPMNAIMGMTAIAKNVLDDKKAIKDCLDKIEYSNRYLLNLINDVLDMSRIESGKVELSYEQMDLGRFLASLETLLKPQADEKSITFAIINQCAGIHPVLADTLRLNQVMVNLIGNAIKFTPVGGMVQVQLLLEREISESAVIRFQVKDSGIGIAKEDMSRIFNAFEQASARTSSQFGGTGLGLTISNHLVQLMGGSLCVESELGKGSLFYFTLELKYSKTKIKPSNDIKAEQNLQPFDFEGRRILIVEDHELNREIAQTILEMNGFITETVCDGQQAVDIFAKKPPQYYDAILMDVRMPVMNGLEATRRIRTMGKADSRTVPIIAMTANAFDEDTRKSIESGMNGHLSKPLEVERFLDMLRNCMR